MYKSIHRYLEQSLKMIASCLFVLLALPQIVVAEQFAMDSFSRDLISGWGETDIGKSWTLSGVNNYSVENGKGLIKIVGGEGSRHAVINSPSLNAEVTTSISWGSEPIDSYIYGGTSLRVSDDRKDFYFARARNSNGRVVVVLDKVVNGSSTSLKSIGLPIPFIAGESYSFRFTASGTNPTILKAKLWPDSQLEPSVWSVTAEDSEAVLQKTGGAGTRAGTGSAFVGETFVSFDNVSISRCVTGVCGVYTPGEFIQYSDSTEVVAPHHHKVTAYDVVIPSSGGFRIEYTLFEVGSNLQWRDADSFIFLNDVFLVKYTSGTANSIVVNHDLHDIQPGDRISVKIEVRNSDQAQYIDAHIKDFKIKTTEMNPMF